MKIPSEFGETSNFSRTGLMPGSPFLKLDVGYWLSPVAAQVDGASTSTPISGTTAKLSKNG